ncbi:glutamate racemase [Marinisporobacter balticus]|uniref:Glutamate racemase n=1 Tax=Marinisporobacter balticus TaxID=2018667 RepID=A0A4R2KLX6_9FIRM|nr:glutamate racemase [Marinisporobacter balticus]TCO74424.1 glutamate racemase [Marinisporobacter balticus]
MKALPIGVFDSGMGGLSVLREMKKLMPQEDYIYYGDSKHIPYGKKTKEALTDICIEIGDYLIKRGVKAIVIACNTATSTVIDTFRNRYTIPIIGIEPALKPAIEQYTDGKIVVLATEVTLKEEKFKNLMDQYTSQAEIVKIPGPKLVSIVESGLTEGKEAEEAIKEVFEHMDRHEISSIVLGCTHYPFLNTAIKKVLGDNITLIDGGFGTALHLKDILSQKGLLKDESENGHIEIINSSNDKRKIDLSYKLLLQDTQDKSMAFSLKLSKA